MQQHPVHSILIGCWGSECGGFLTVKQKNFCNECLQENLQLDLWNNFTQPGSVGWRFFFFHCLTLVWLFFIIYLETRLSLYLCICKTSWVFLNESNPLPIFAHKRPALMSDNQFVSLESPQQDGQPDILYMFWNDVTNTLSEEFHRATEGKFSPPPFSVNNKAADSYHSVFIRKVWLLLMCCFARNNSCGALFIKPASQRCSHNNKMWSKIW